MHRQVIKLFSLLMCFFISFFIIGCGGGGGGGSALSSNLSLSMLTISPNMSIIQKGEFNKYKAIATYADGRSLEVTNKVTWSSSDTSIATIDNTGLAEIINESGNAKITATYNSVTSAAATLIATRAPVQSISLIPSSPSTIANGLTEQYKAIATYSDGSSSQINTGITWSSSNTSVATIDNTGLAKVVSSSGSTTITATYDGVVSSSLTLTATSAVLQSLSIQPFSATIAKGLTEQYIVIATYSDGSSSQITTGVTWRSSNNSVATVDTKGLARVVGGSGSTTITATYDGAVSSSVTLTATSAAVQSISLIPSSPSIIANGLTQQYIVIATYTDGSLSQITTGITWKSSNTSVATIDITGLAKVISSSGSTTITATYGSINSPSAILSATPAIVQAISVKPFAATIAQGSTEQYTAMATYSDGSSSPITTGITWGSSNTSVATIDITGLAKVVGSSGNTTITATYNSIVSSPVTLTASAI